VGELPSSDNWSFQTSWCPRNPDLIATASFDGKIGIHSLQNTHQTNDTNKPSRENITNPDDIFGSAPADEGSNATVLSLKQPPKWLRPPVSVAFGFGGQLASIGTSPAVNGKPGSSVLKLQEVVTEEDVVDRAKKLASAIGSQEELGNFCEDMAQKESGGASAVAGWKALKSLFTTNSRDELVTLLGFSKGEIANQVSEAIAKFKLTIKPEEETREPDSIETEGDGKGDITPKAQSEAGAGASVSGSKTPSEVDSTTDKTAEEDAESVEPSLFDDETRTGTPQIDTGAGAHFFSSIGNIRNALPDHMQVPHKAYAKDSSVAATIGSRASSVASDTMKSNTFKIYPSNESEVDRLVTRALVVGDFESAVTLCLSVDRFADALVLAVRGGPDLLAKTQQAYFEKRTTSLPYLRLFQSIVSEDLSDVVQNADLTEWQEVFVVLCTFARVDEFNSLTEQLGQRIEFQSRLVNGANASGNSEKAKELRKNALLCYLAAGRLEKAVNIWVDEMREEEDAAVNGEGAETSNASRYTAHARALQTFMEKVAVFKSATAYSDRDLAAVDSIENGARTYPLAALYDRYYEYADLLATQGQTELAVRYIKQTPANYKGSRGEESGLTSVRARYILGSSATDKSSLPTASTSSAAAGLMQQPVVSAPSAYTPYQQPFVPAPAPITSGPTSSVYSPYVPPQPVQPNQPTGTGTAASNPYTPAVNPYNPAGSSSPYAPGPSNYNPSSTSYGAYGQTSRPTPTVVAPPPMARSKGNDSPGPIPAAQRRDIPGWNDAPSVQGPKRTASAGPGKPQPIMSPFPEGQAPPTPVQMPMNQPYHQPGQFPPQTGRAQAPPIAPPPRGAQPPRPASTQPPPPPPMSNSAQYQSNKPMSPPLARAGPPPGVIAGPPPARAMSPLVPPQHRVMSPPAQQQQQHIRPPSAGPYQPPPGVRAGPPPSGQPARASPAPARTAPPPASVKAAPKYRQSRVRSERYSITY
jgi:protein transport protein SEC31